MKNIEVNTLIKKGFGTVKYKNLPSKEAYKVVKFSLELEKAAKAYEEEKAAIVKKVYGDNLEAAQKFANWLVVLKEDPKAPRPEGLMEDAEFIALDRELNGLVAELDAAEADMKINPLSFDDFYKLVEQNEQLLDVAATATLEGALWKEEEEEKEKKEEEK